MTHAIDELDYNNKWFYFEKKCLQEGRNGRKKKTGWSMNEKQNKLVRIYSDN